MLEATPVLFSEPELWLLQAVVRHEMAQQRQWSFPPASVSLSDKIAEGLYLCIEHGQKEVCLQLSRGDCLVLDYTVPQDAKDSNGVPLGKPILIKAIRARVLLAGQAWPFDGVEPVGLPSARQVHTRLRELDDEQSSGSPGRDADDSTSAVS